MPFRFCFKFGLVSHWKKIEKKLEADDIVRSHLPIPTISRTTCVLNEADSDKYGRRMCGSEMENDMVPIPIPLLYTVHRWELSPISVISDIGLSLISEPSILD